MDRVIAQHAPTVERRRIVAAWEALERAEALLPADHPATWHLERALRLLEADWRAHHAAPAAAGDHARP